ncbi:DUF2663 family protein [Pullulanibacillus sp. KACC 23026]|uniref:DUF2663 family protein n=1 Tax=Pullulanibacillus sp. KACC 23026 TaxID=3028315 RepID=UPI0023AF129C|nr:DUF2663 family protein [Pullulanibacillus sp. KACC 23026]WEG11405.1 DUF2663 family protein [Pullulanibacillus sp. KACC 23026]
MDKVGSQLDDMFNKGELSEVTHGVLKKLVKKRKKERYWRNLQFINVMMLCCLYLIVLFTLFPFLKVYQNSFNGFMKWAFIYWHFLMVFFIIACHFALKIVTDKYNEMDGKYERLRKEIIDRENELWNRHVEDARSRFQVLTLFDDKDVNLFHK